MTDVSIEPGMIGSLIFLGMIGLFIAIGIIWVFVDANKPRNKKIMNDKAPTWIEFSWIIPVVLVAIFALPLFVPFFFAWKLSQTFDRIKNAENRVQLSALALQSIVFAWFYQGFLRQ